MLRDEQMIQFAKRAGMYGNGLLPSRGTMVRFGKLVAAAEREACLCEQYEPLVAAARELLRHSPEIGVDENPAVAAALVRLRAALPVFDTTASAAATDH